MQQVAVVAVLEGASRLHSQAEHLPPWPAPRLQKLGRVRTIDEFRRHICVTGVDTAVEPLGDVGMIETLEGEHLAREFLRERGIAGQ